MRAIVGANLAESPGTVNEASLCLVPLRDFGSTGHNGRHQRIAESKRDLFGQCLYAHIVLA